MMSEMGLPSGSSFFSTGITERKQKKRNEGNPSNSSAPVTGCAVKGMIPYPCCPKEKVIVYLDAHGQVSNKCPRCGKFARFDYDRMTATEVSACRGASRIYKIRK